MFMTSRTNDPLGLFQPTYACNPDNDQLQVNLVLAGRQFDPPGGWICVRPAFDNSFEFRYYPPGDTRKSSVCWLSGTRRVYPLESVVPV